MKPTIQLNKLKRKTKQKQQTHTHQLLKPTTISAKPPSQINNTQNQLCKPKETTSNQVTTNNKQQNDIQPKTPQKNTKISKYTNPQKRKT